MWLTTSLLERSLSYASTRELDEVSRSLEQTGREFYQRSREALKNDALAGRLAAAALRQPRQSASGPKRFASSGTAAQPERFYLSGKDGDHLNYLVRRESEVLVWSRSLGGWPWSGSAAE